jgi:hypothetical protein
MVKEYQQYSVILNSKNIVPGSNNSVLKYDFDTALKFENAQVAVNTVNIYFSWFNISDALNNNKFSYKWFDIDGNLTQVFNIVIKDGYYNVNNLNEYIQSILVSRGHYLVHEPSGKFVYHIELVTNPVYYTIEMNLYAMMSLASAGAIYIKGSTDWGLPNEATTIQVILNSTNLFSSLIGFENGTYPEVSDTNNYIFSSTKAPVMDPISSLMMTCSFASQGGFSNPDNIIYSFTSSGVKFGGLVEKQPVLENYVNIRDGTYSNFTIELLNQNFQRINIKDSDMLIILNFRLVKPEIGV